jgi:hypothetical protein
VLLTAPIVLISPKVAHHLERPLVEAARAAHRNGYVLPPEVAAAITDISRLAEHYRRQVADGAVASEVSVSPQPQKPPASATLDCVETGLVLGVSPHGAADLARRGVIAARKSGRQWVFDPTDVEQYRQHRAARTAA